MPKKQTYKQMMNEILKPKRPKTTNKENIRKVVGGGRHEKISKI